MPSVEDEDERLRSSALQNAKSILVARQRAERELAVAQEALRVSHDQFAAILNQSPVGVYLLDARLRVQHVNPRGQPVFSDLPSVLGRNFREILQSHWPADVAAELIPRLERTLETGEPAVFKGFSVRREEREYYDLEIHRVVLPSGEQGVVCYFVDITAHVRAQEAAQREIAERKIAEAKLAERALLSTLRGDIAALLAQPADVELTLRGCCELLVQHLDATFARIWVAAEDDAVLVLRASAGFITDTGDSLARVHVGEFHIGRIAQSRRAHLTNDAAHDPEIAGCDHDEDIVAFAGYPLLSVGKLVGVLALYSSRALSDAVIGDLAPLMDAIAASIERRKAERELVAAKERAEVASRAKDRFLATLSHELRTPLTPVLMTATALREDERIPVDVRQQLAMMERNIGLEARLIDDLLDLTKVTHGKLLLRDELCDAHSLISHAVEILRDEAQSKPVTLRLDLAARRTALRCDPSRIQQIFWNLLRNAIKFTPAGGTIAIRTRDETGERLRIEVSDSGIGLAPDVLKSIFEPFEQAGRENDHRFGGLGLGLTIANAIVHLHGGTIRVESAGPGQGSTFIVELPRVGGQATGIHPLATPGGSPLVFHDCVEAGPERPLRLLVVDDHEPTLAVLRRLLVRSGHQVVTAGSVAAAMAKGVESQFDVVISDLGLPDGTGMELMAKLHEMQPQISGIALSGYGMEDDLRRSQAAGFVAHLVKPIDFEQLRRTLRTVGHKSPP